MTETEKIRRAVADYIGSSGCGCCASSSNDAHEDKLAELLGVPRLEKNPSVWNWWQFASKPSEGSHE